MLGFKIKKKFYLFIFVHVPPSIRLYREFFLTQVMIIRKVELRQLNSYFLFKQFWLFSQNCFAPKKNQTIRLNDPYKHLNDLHRCSTSAHVEFRHFGFLHYYAEKKFHNVSCFKKKKIPITCY